jgi:flagellar biosynthesis component FlhA
VGKTTVCAVWAQLFAREGHDVLAIDADPSLSLGAAFGLPAVWVTEHERQHAELSGYTIVEPSSVISTHLQEVIRRNADKILVIDKGQIVESGSHEKLMKKKGIYRKLHDLQFPEDEEIQR